MRALALLLALVLIAAAGCNQPPKPAATPPLTPEMMAATQPAPAITEPREEPTYRPAPRPIRQPGGTLPPFAATAGGRTYVVQKGEGLMAVARKLYNDPGRVKDIMALNPDITDQNKLKEGQVIKVPEK